MKVGIIGIILTFIFGLICGGVGGGALVWNLKPPEKHVTEVKTEVQISVDSKSESKGYQIQSTEVFYFPEKVFALVLSNSNNVTNYLKMVLTNTNYYKSTTNKYIERLTN